MLTPIDIFALIAVMLVGLPHGAFDGAIAFFLGAGRSAVRMTGFVIGYSLLAGLYVWFWYLAPMPALAGFLILSIIHFGSGDIQPLDPGPSAWAGKALKMVRIFTHGGVVGIVLPSLHPQEVARLYAVLTGGDAGPIMEITGGLFPVWGAGFMVYLLAAIPYRMLRGAVFEIAILCGIAAFLPPLAGFAVYFCLVHSRRHFLVIWTAMQAMLSRQTILVTGFILTIITWAGAGAAFYLQADLAAVSTGDAALRTVFVLLAALTVPHMILVDSIFRPVLEKRAIS